MFYYSSAFQSSKGAEIYRATASGPLVGEGGTLSHERMDSLNTPGDDLVRWVSPDDCVLYLIRRAGADGTSKGDIYRAARPPLP